MCDDKWVHDKPSIAFAGKKNTLSHDSLLSPLPSFGFKHAHALDPKGKTSDCLMKISVSILMINSVANKNSAASRATLSESGEQFPAAERQM
jgi:hypothetical protein